MEAMKTLRDIRPRLTVADFSACLPFTRLLFAIAVVAALSALGAPNGLAERHDRPVPILMYHVIAHPPAGAPFPGLYVAPAEFAEQMRALKGAGWHAVTLDQIQASWRSGATNVRSCSRLLPVSMPRPSIVST